ncbi:MAG: FadR/GntR family transcriptional regulator [Paracoccaceae bacterium]
MARAPKECSGRAASAEAIAEGLARRIRSGEVAPGARLPTEQAIASAHGVSRPVVREAISRLKSEGLARSVRGSGLFATEPGARRAFRLGDDAPGDDADRLFALFELRTPVEMAAARLAAARRTEEDLARIAETQARMHAARDLRAFVSADQAFHHAIAVATGNPHFVALSDFLASTVLFSIEAIRTNSPQADVEAQALREHQRILSAIRARDPEAAAFAVLDHHECAKGRVEHYRPS